MHGYIYKISNTENNKLYIGQTTKDIETRFKQHLNKADYFINHYNGDVNRNIHLYQAINKYGKNCFSVELVDSAETQEELDSKEFYWINFYDTITNGYNMMPGGSKENPMNSELIKTKHDNIMRSDSVRQKISMSMKKYKQKNGVSDEHRKNLSLAQHNRKCFIRSAEHTYASLDNIEKVNQLISEGWTMYDSINIYEHEFNPFATRSVGCYCILDTGERFDFSSILDAGKWWYNKYKPFGDCYSSATYQRKIEASMAGKEITYALKNRKDYIKITNIKWFHK